MPGFYKEGEYDVAGFAVGSVKQDKVIDGKSIQEGDVLLGLPSSGVHSNGFSLARKVLEVKAISIFYNIRPLMGIINNLVIVISLLCETDVPSLLTSKLSYCKIASALK